MARTRWRCASSPSQRATSSLSRLTPSSVAAMPLTCATRPSTQARLLFLRSCTTSWCATAATALIRTSSTLRLQALPSTATRASTRRSNSPKSTRTAPLTRKIRKVAMWPWCSVTLPAPGCPKKARRAKTTCAGKTISTPRGKSSIWARFSPARAAPAAAPCLPARSKKTSWTLCRPTCRRSRITAGSPSSRARCTNC